MWGGQSWLQPPFRRPDATIEGMNYGCEAAIGAVCGLRTFTGPATIAAAANRHVLDLNRTPVAWLASDHAVTAAVLLAAGELVADKLPFMPNRTEAPGLAARFIAGAICGVAIAGRRKRTQRILSGVIAGTAALAAAYAGVQYRKHVKLPPLAAALLEDAVAVGAAQAVVTGLCR
jgi:uncharacterized membrane protein